jgi:hypothetical protein
VRNVQTWIEQAGISSGPLFRPVNRHGRGQDGWPDWTWQES